jgi:hypothetical protein
MCGSRIAGQNCTIEHFADISDTVGGRFNCCAEK